MKRSVVTLLMAGAVALGAAGAWAGWYAVKDDVPADISPQAGGDGVPLVDTYWKLVVLDGKPVAAVNLPAREPYLTLQSNEGEPRMVGFGGCNRMSGGYALDGDKVTFSDVIATRMACAKGMDVEEGFSRALGEVVRWGIDGTTLRLYDAQGEVVAKFEQRLL